MFISNYRAMNLPTLHATPILVIVAASVAAVKAPFVLRRLREAGYAPQVIVSERALHFVTPLALTTAAENTIHTDQSWFEPQAGAKHLELAHFPKMVLVIGATADLMAKAALGLADDLACATLLSVRCPVLWVPALNPNMWLHPATQSHKSTLEGWGQRFLGPLEGKLGTQGEASGLGRMVEPEGIVEAVNRLLTVQDLAGKKIIVTAGPTREYLDPVRFISNPSSGKMGFAVAQRAASRGATVSLISGPVHLAPPEGVEYVQINSALEMKAAVDLRFDGGLDGVDGVVMTAAIADYRAKDQANEKQAKVAENVTLELIPNPDILKGLGARKASHQVLVGFAMETHAGLERASLKVQRKNLDFICLNYPTQVGLGFGSDDNDVTCVWADSRVEEWGRRSKLEVADLILDRMLEVWKG
jgi:phosphopantothenoylcysteine decarboxylase / phosphopantothenate---cysteine ligase